MSNGKPKKGVDPFLTPGQPGRVDPGGDNQKTPGEIPREVAGDFRGLGLKGGRSC